MSFKIQSLNPKKSKKKYIIHKHSDHAPTIKKPENHVKFDIIHQPLFRSISKKAKKNF